MVQDFPAFDELGWQVLYQYPRWLSHKIHGARGQLISALEVYFFKAPDERGDAAWSMSTEENEMRALETNTHEITVIMVVVYWA